MEPARDRLIAAAISLVAERGCEQVTAGTIAARAGLTTGEFGRHFSSADDCLRGAFEAVCDRFDRQLLPIYLRPAPWRERMRAAARATVDFCRDHEEQVSFAIGEKLRHPSHAQGERSLRLHLEEIESGRQELPAAERVPASATEFAVGCFLERAKTCHSRGELAQLERWLPDLMYSVTDAFLGPVVAEEEMRSMQGELAPDAEV